MKPRVLIVYMVLWVIGSLMTQASLGYIQTWHDLIALTGYDAACFGMFMLALQMGKEIGEKL